MWLAVDCGNTLVKWAAFDGAAMRSHNAAKLAATSRLAAAARGREVWLSNVGGAAAGRQLKKTLSAAAKVARIKSRAVACGVKNNYAPPESLGSDRWLCLLAARRRFRRVVVVSAGTAVTIDGLAEDGIFRGGLILPGLQLMAEGLKQKTNLPAVSASGGELPAAPPNNTKAAMLTGAALAVGGAALEFRRRYLPGAAILLTGGDSEKLQPFLPAAKIAPHLVLHGIAQLRAAEQ